MNAFDTAVYHWINGLAGNWPVLDFIMSFFSEYALEMYAVLFILAWFILPRSDSKYRHSLVVAVFAGVFALILNVIIAHIWFRPRPFTVLPPGSFDQLIPHAADASFPSDHASGSVGFAAASWGKSAKWISWLFTIIAVIVMVSRVYTGVHWPTDILASLVVGTIAGRVMWKLSPLLQPITSFGLRLFRFGEKKSHYPADHS
jgi:undecaprenyl-diphosphatase